MVQDPTPNNRGTPSKNNRKNKTTAKSDFLKPSQGHNALRKFKQKNLKAGEVLIKEGNEDDNLYVLLKGCLKVTKIREKREYEVATITAGKVVGELSFLDKKPRSADVTAFKESTVAIIPREYYEEFLKTLPDWLTKLQKTIISRLREANKKIII
ncbi:MAG: cyclic nucleotide-binding domain-containing protein [Bdellovibrionota bacterium]|nr:cyclic nucleotide-binding domain-containing protein [Bdellovibrionota bacterium]